MLSTLPYKTSSSRGEDVVPFVSCIVIALKQGEGSLDLSIHDPVFLRAIDALAVPALLIGHRVIT
jgi:hypothetical protein